MTVCVGCASVLIFDENVLARMPTVVELAEAMAYPDVVRVIRYLRGTL